jgi:hypothetical protein
MAGEESASAMEADIIINAADGLPNMHPNFEQLQLVDGNLRGPDGVDIHDDDLPNSLIVTNLNSVVFKSDDEKVEQIFMDFISTPTPYLTHFRPPASHRRVGNGKVHFAFFGGSASCVLRPLWT